MVLGLSTPRCHTFPAVCCASPISGASIRLRLRTTASPIRRMGTSVGMVGGSLTDDGCLQEVAVLVEHGTTLPGLTAYRQRLRFATPHTLPTEEPKSGLLG